MKLIETNKDVIFYIILGFWFLIGIFVALFAGEYAWVFNLFMIGGFTILVLLKSFNKKFRSWLNLKYDRI